MVNEMEDQGKCVMPDWESEYHKMREVYGQLKAKLFDMECRLKNKEREIEVLQARLDIVYLIFGGRNHG